MAGLSLFKSLSFSESGALFAIVLGLLAYFVLTVGRKVYRGRMITRNIPGPDYSTMVDLMGRTFTARPVDVYRLAMALSKDYKNIAKTWIGTKCLIFLFHPADVEVILGSNVHIDKSDEYRVFAPWFGNGLLISTGKKWKHHRKMIAPTFHMSILKNFVPTFYENSLKVVEKMRAEGTHEFDCHEYMSGAAVDILLETAMGYKEKRSEETGYNYAMAVMKLCDILHQRHYKMWLRHDKTFNISPVAKKHNHLLTHIMNLTTKVVSFKKQEFIEKQRALKAGTYVEEAEEHDATEDIKREVNYSAENVGYNNGTAVRDDLDDDDNDIGEKKRLAFLDALTAAGQAADVDFSEKEVLDQVNTIMFEGHDTTAAGSSFALVMLGIHKDIQARCVEEVDNIFQKTDRPCTFADTLEMKYIERVIMETLRKYPPVPLIARQTTEEVKLGSGDYSIPVGATVVITPLMLHRREDSFPNPDKFDPDNFLPEKCSTRHYYSYTPFSAGPRSCVGRKYAMLKLKVLLSTILRKYVVHCDMKEEDLALQADIILKINQGFNIRLEERVY